QDAKDADRRRIELQAKEADLERARQELEQGKAALQRDRGELERMRTEARQRAIAAAVQVPSEPTSIGPPPSPERDDLITMPISKHDAEELETFLHKGLPSRADDFSKEPMTGFEVEPATGIDHRMEARATGLPDFEDEKTGDDGPSIGVEIDE